jgi:hypothetical protein
MKIGLAHLLELLMVIVALSQINGYGNDSHITTSSHVVDSNKRVYGGDRTTEVHVPTVAERRDSKESWHMVEEHLAGDLSIYSPIWVKGLDFRTIDIESGWYS